MISNIHIIGIFKGEKMRIGQKKKQHMAENFLIPTKDPKPQIQEVLSSQGMIKTKKTSIL